MRARRKEPLTGDELPEGLGMPAGIVAGDETAATQRVQRYDRKGRHRCRRNGGGARATSKLGWVGVDIGFPKATADGGGNDCGLSRGGPNDDYRAKSGTEGGTGDKRKGNP
jgi:hypothetical protein